MKFMIPFLIAAHIAALPVASVAQAQSGNPGASGVALPKTAEVMVILTAKQGVTLPTNHGHHAVRDSGNSEALSRRENPPVVFAGRW